MRNLKVRFISRGFEKMLLLQDKEQNQLIKTINYTSTACLIKLVRFPERKLEKKCLINLTAFN